MSLEKVNEEAFIRNFSNRFSAQNVNCIAKLIQQEFGRDEKVIIPAGLVGVFNTQQGFEYTVAPELQDICPADGVKELFLITAVGEEFLLFHALLETSNVVLTLIDCHLPTDERLAILQPIANKIGNFFIEKYGKQDFTTQVLEDSATIPSHGSDSGVYCLLQIQSKLQNDFWYTDISENLVQSFKLHYDRFYEQCRSTSPTPTAPPIHLHSTIPYRFVPEVQFLYPSLARNHFNNFVQPISTAPQGPNCKTQDNYTKYVVEYYPNLPHILKKHQVEAIEAVALGHDVICLLPTSYGKTLAMIAPILMKARESNTKCVHLIISPLISLCEEMVTEWGQLGLQSHHVTGRPSEITELKTSYDELPEGSVLHLLSSPELMLKGGLDAFLRETNVMGFSIDEGHVVSLWSEDFRKQYGNIYLARAYIKCPLAVYSATVTPTQLEDIKQKTGIRRENLKLIIISPNRPEIFFDVAKKEPNFSGFKNLIAELADKGKTCKKVLIFVGRKLAATDLLLDFRMNLPNDGKIQQQCPQYLVELYSGSTSEATRRLIEKDFRKSDSTIRVLIATSAFGMGLNIMGLHDVVIQDLPDTFGELMQLGGRASRDGHQGTCRIVVPDKSTKGLATTLRNKSCIRKLILRDFCTPPEEIIHQTSNDPCQKCNCCINCRNACECNSPHC